MFTACGDPATGQLKTEATCDTSGDYATASDKAAYTAAVGDQTEIDAAGYRLTAKVAMKTVVDEQEVTQDYMTLNLIIKENRTDAGVNYEMAMKMKMKNPLAAANEPTEYEIYAYYKDGKVYGEDENGNKYYEEVSFDDFFDGEEMQMLSCSNLQQLLSLVNAVGEVTVTTQGNNFKVVANGSATIGGQSIAAGATAYINFNDEGKITAAQLDYSMSYFTSQMNFQITMSGFDGNIAYPDLTKYQPAPESLK